MILEASVLDLIILHPFTSSEWNILRKTVQGSRRRQQQPLDGAPPVRIGVQLAQLVEERLAEPDVEQRGGQQRQTLRQHAEQT